MSLCTFVEMYENEKQENRLRQRAFKDFLKPNLCFQIRFANIS